jgi:hypothetical protein
MHRESPPRVVHGNLKIGRAKRWRKLLPDGKEPQKTHRNRSRLTSQISFRWKSAATKRKTLDKYATERRQSFKRRSKDANQLQFFILNPNQICIRKKRKASRERSKDDPKSNYH